MYKTVENMMAERFIYIERAQVSKAATRAAYMLIKHQRAGKLPAKTIGSIVEELRMPKRIYSEVTEEFLCYMDDAINYGIDFRWEELCWH